MITIRGPWLVNGPSPGSPAHCQDNARGCSGRLRGRDAENVAAYIYELFYSKSAQARNKFVPSRIELSRLTVRQYKNAIADLFGSFQALVAGMINGTEGGILEQVEATA